MVSGRAGRTGADGGPRSLRSLADDCQGWPPHRLPVVAVTQFGVTEGWKVRMHRGLLFWGLGLLSAGVVALAIQQNLVDRNVMAGAWRLWPLILVAIGLSLVLS